MVGVLSLALLVFAVGCGGDDNEGSAGSGGGNAASGSDSGDSVKELAAQKVSEYASGTLDFPGPSKAFDPGEGKAQAIACGNAAPVCQQQAQYATEALQALGWDVPQHFDGEFSPQKQGSFLDRAVQNDLDAVIMVSVDVDTIKSSVDRALDAGLIIACTFCVSGEQYADKIFDVRPDFIEQGEMQAWAALARNGSDAKVVHFNDKAFDPPPLRVQGAEKVIKENCPDCSYEVRDFATASISKPGPPEFTAMLSAKPEGTVTDVIAHYDGLGIAFAKTLNQRGREDIAIGAYDITPESVQAMVGGDVPYESASIGPYTYAEWAAADLIARKKAGEELWEGYESLPNVLMTPENAEKYTEPPYDPVPEGDWQGEFKKLWTAN